VLFYNCYKCKMCLKIKDNLILISTFRFICCNYKFWLKYMEKIQTHKDNRKDRSFLTAFSDNHEYNHLILHQNWTGISFIRVSCNVESESRYENQIVFYFQTHFTFVTIIKQHHSSIFFCFVLGKYNYFP